MSDSEAFERRLSAVERAIADGDDDIGALAEVGDRERRLRALEDRVDAIEETIADLEAATQALRGYVGNVRSVNADVEQRADAALAAVERLEDRLGEGGRDNSSAGASRSTAGPDEKRRPTGTGDERRRTGTTDRNDRPHTHAGRPAGRGRSPAGGVRSPTGVAGSPDGATRSDLGGVDAGPEMPVPGSENGSKPSDRDDRRANGDRGTDGDGVIDRVRDAL